MDEITIETKLQKIYFEDTQGNLGTHFITENERVTIKQAEEILTEKGIEFKTIFQVRKENVEIHLTHEELETLLNR